MAELLFHALNSVRFGSQNLLGIFFGNKPQLRNPYLGHEEESIERLKIVNSMKEKIQQAFGVVGVFQSQHDQTNFTDYPGATARIMLKKPSRLRPRPEIG